MDEQHESTNKSQKDASTKLSRSRDLVVSRFFGGLTGLFTLLVPLIYFWITSTEKVSLAQIAVATEQVRVTAEQIQYITKRMNDSDMERDLYKSEMLACQKELRSLKK